MAKFSERLKALRAESGLSQAEFSKQTGITKSSVNMYERGEREPGLDRLEIIADFYNVDMDFLLGKSDIKNKTQLLERQKENLTENDRLTERDRKDIAKDLERLRQDLESADTLMFDGDPMTDEARESILAAMKLGLEAAKIKNKEKYTPKKYKKD